jgi:hypothetical protein
MLAGPRRALAGRPGHALSRAFGHAVRLGAACACAALCAPASAGAQAPGGVEVGGEVPSYLELSLTQPSGFATFPAGMSAGTYALSITAAVTSTAPPVYLSVSDGEVAAGPRRGHLVSGSSMLPAPLQAAGGAGPFQSLDTPFGPRLAQWGEPVAQAPVTVHLRQRVGRRSGRGPYRKLLYITLSTQTP